MTITGKFIDSKPTEFVGAKNFATRRFWIDITRNPDYPNTPEIKLLGDKVSLVDNLKKGDDIEVHLNLEGKRVKKKDGSGDIIINEISAWKIEVMQKQSAATVQPRTAPVATTTHMPAGATAFANDGGGSDDLPF